MKRIFHILFFAFLVAIVVTDCKPKPEDELPGGIYGTVTDKATGEPISVAGVELHPGGQKTVTGSEGQYEFTNIEGGEYTLVVTKTGYIELDNIKVTVKPGQKTQSVIQLEKLPLSLRVVDGNGNDISSLDFGVEEDVTSRTFSIFNDGVASLTWWIEENCPWISDVKSMISNKQSGKLEAGKQEPIKVTINRSLAGEGLKSYILNINSDNGSKELTITVGEATGLPILQTNPVSNLSSTSVICNGTIINPGSPTYMERGFVYGPTAQPTIEENTGKLTAVVNENADFSTQLTGLSSNHTYYVRAYAINTVGVAYGNDENFTTGAVNTEISTSAVTEINATSAILNATIVMEGNPAYTERGFCYATQTSPTVSDNKKVVEGSGTGVYSCSVADLEYQTTYYVRAYVIQNGKTIYGNEVHFETVWETTILNTSAVSQITSSSAVLNATITQEGKPAYTERGFCYSTSGQPTIANNKIAVSGYGEGSYSYNISGLTNQTVYYVRAYVIQDGQPVYGNVVNFTTVYNVAHVNTSAVTKIGTTEATFNGVVTVVGDPQYTERGFVYGTTSRPTLNDTKVLAGGMGVAGDFNRTVKNLTMGVTYYVRAYVLQDEDVVYGNVVSFSTVAPPEVHTLEISNLTPVSPGGIAILSWNVTLNGYIVASGDPAYVERGFCYATTMNPTTNRKVVQGSGTGKFSVTITGLQNYQKYYVRAYAKMPTGEYVYGQNVTFDTYDF